MDSMGTTLMGLAYPVNSPVEVGSCNPIIFTVVGLGIFFVVHQPVGWCCLNFSGSGTC